MNLRKTFTLLMASLSLASASALADGPKEKFESIMEGIEKEIKATTQGEVRIDDLASSGLRQYLFQIQTLADVYQQRYAELEQVRRVSKRFEDQIGAYRKSREDLEGMKRLGKDKKTIERFEQRRDQQSEVLADFVKSNSWNYPSSRAEDLRNILERIKWDNAKQDRTYIYGAISDQLKAIDNVDWDMFVLEAYNGLHSLRKKVRWVKLEMEVLSDIIGSHNRSCDKGAIRPDAPEANGKCLVSECHYQSLRGLYSKLGDIKDIGENYEADGQHLPKRYMEEADRLYKKVKRENLFGGLSAELKSCR